MGRESQIGRCGRPDPRNAQARNAHLYVKRIISWMTRRSSCCVAAATRAPATQMKGVRGAGKAPPGLGQARVIAVVLFVSNPYFLWCVATEMQLLGNVKSLYGVVSGKSRHGRKRN